MVYNFKQAAHLAGKDYPRGNHEVSEKAEAHPFFVKLVRAGLIVEVEPSKIVSPESFKAKQDRLLNKIAARHNKPAKVEAPKEEAPIEVPAEEAPVEESVKEEASEEKKPKGKSKKQG